MRYFVLSIALLALCACGRQDPPQKKAPARNGGSGVNPTAPSPEKRPPLDEAKRK